MALRGTRSDDEAPDIPQPHEQNGNQEGEEREKEDICCLDRCRRIVASAPSTLIKLVIETPVNKDGCEF
jgi:hypothetical protein